MRRNKSQNITVKLIRWGLRKKSDSFFIHFYCENPNQMTSKHKAIELKWLSFYQLLKGIPGHRSHFAGTIWFYCRWMALIRNSNSERASCAPLNMQRCVALCNVASTDKFRCIFPHKCAWYSSSVEYHVENVDKVLSL